MKKGKKKGSWPLAVILILLAVVLGIIFWKLWEYRAGESYYGSLREIARMHGGWAL